MHYRKQKNIGTFFVLLMFGMTMHHIFAQESGSNLELAKQMSEAYVEVAEKVKPAVVTIECVNLYFNEETGAAAESEEITPESMLPEEIHRFLNRMQEDGVGEARAGGCLGTGVIISEDGVVVTNCHVVKDAVSIKVRLDNGELLKAEVVGVDPKVDLAVLQLITAEPLPVAVLGDSDTCKVGSITIAIGAPEGFKQSVTFGNISALQRSEGLDDEEVIYQSYIQTDAAINHGNSGGPLVTLDGEVIGINSAGFDEADNLSFAIPINMVKDVVKKILKYGEVPRGYVGVGTYDLSNYCNGKAQKGVLVEEVYPETPAAVAGLQMGDILLSYNGTELESNQQVMRLVADSEIGSIAVIKYIRDGKPESVEVTVAAQPEVLDMPVLDLMASLGGNIKPPESYASELLGITVVALPLQEGFPDDVDFFQDMTGLLITDTDGRLSTHTSHLIPGMIIKFIDFTKVSTLADIKEVEKNIKPGSEVLIQSLLADIPVTSIMDLGLDEDVDKKFGDEE